MNGMRSDRMNRIILSPTNILIRTAVEALALSPMADDRLDLRGRSKTKAEEIVLAQNGHEKW